MNDTKLTVKPEIKAAVVDGAVLIKVFGRGTVQNSSAFYDYTLNKIKSGFKNIGIDLIECPYMDSTFMGVLAALSKEIYGKTNHFLKIIGICDDALIHLKTTGLTRILDIQMNGVCLGECIIEHSGNPLLSKPLDKKELTTHMLMAHKELMQLTQDNKDRFENVVALMEKSLKKQK